MLGDYIGDGISMGGNGTSSAGIDCGNIGGHGMGDGGMGVMVMDSSSVMSDD